MILVTGARGVVGAALIDKLSMAGRQVCSVSRNAPESSLHWDMTLPLDSAASHRLSGLDTVLHCAPIWLLPAHLDILASSGMNRLLVFSSTSASSKQGSTDPSEQSLAQRLVEAEDAIRSFCEERSIAATIFRPSMIYGHGRDENVMHLARFIRRYGFAVVAGAGSGSRQPVHADDLVAAVLSALDSPLTHGKAYEVAGAEVLSYRSMLERLFVAMDRTPRIVSVPVPILRLALRAAAAVRIFDYTPSMATRMNEDLAYDYAAATLDFGYAPRAFLTDPPNDLKGCV